MAVFTPLSDADLTRVAKAWGISGELAFDGIADGIENSSFLIHQKLPGEPARPEWVLTIVEALSVAEVEFVCSHLRNLTAAGVAVAGLASPPEAKAAQKIAGKPALLFRFLQGTHVSSPEAGHCRQVGRELARAHCVGSDNSQACSHDWHWLQSAARTFAPGLSAPARRLLESEMAAQASWQARYTALPKAVLHADLFRDNVLFEGTQLSGLIDWYSACTGPMVYDIAIALNDWCRNRANRLEPALMEAFLEGYAEIRKPAATEAGELHMAQRRAALRFWLSRIQAAKASPQPGSGAGPVLYRHKDPAEFERLLAWLRKPA